MRIPADAVIADGKVTKYLLAPRQWDDRSEFLRRAGFSLENWIELRDSIRKLADSVEATEDGSNEYGTFYRVEGPLIGPSKTLQVTLIWMQRLVDGRFFLVTLKPRRE